MKRLSIVILMLATTVTMYGQHGGGSDKTESPWWVGLNAGANVNPGWQLGLEVGRWMSPEWGLSARMSTLDAHVLTATATLTMDWSNLNGVRVGGWHLYTPLSAGAAVLWGEHADAADVTYALGELRTTGTYVFSAALGLCYRGRQMETFVEIGAMTFGTNVDWPSVESTGIDVVPVASLGVRYVLPSKEVRRYIPGNSQSDLEAETSEAGREPKGLVDDMLLTNERLHLPAVAIRFPVDGSELDDNAMRQLNLFLTQLDALEDDKDFYILASADVATASEAHNKKLCERRCRSVYEVLVNDFGVDASRLRVLSGGGYSEYEHQFTEQMVLIIQHTSETEEVVERWIPSY